MQIPTADRPNPPSNPDGSAENAATGTAVIDVTGLTKRYGAITAVEDISFAVPRGETAALLIAFFFNLTMLGWSMGLIITALILRNGLGAIMFEGIVPMEALLTAFGLNLIYLAAAAAFFLYTFRFARRTGLLMRVGE